MTLITAKCNYFCSLKKVTTPNIKLAVSSICFKKYITNGDNNMYGCIKVNQKTGEDDSGVNASFCSSNSSTDAACGNIGF